VASSGPTEAGAALAALAFTLAFSLTFAVATGRKSLHGDLAKRRQFWFFVHIDLFFEPNGC
jgi:hypothetical protein